MFYENQHFGITEYFCKEGGRDFSESTNMTFLSLVNRYVLPDDLEIVMI